MSISRALLLRQLIEYEKPIGKTVAELSRFEWDVTEPVAFITPHDVMRILERHLHQELTSSQLTDWADLVECREDVGYSSHAEVLSDVVFRLANPNLRDEVTANLVAELLEKVASLKA
jgi:hypothetical protein